MPCPYLPMSSSLLKSRYMRTNEDILTTYEAATSYCTFFSTRTHPLNTNKLAKAWKMRKPPGTLSLKKFGPNKLWVENVWAQNILINFLAELDHYMKIIFCTAPRI